MRHRSIYEYAQVGKIPGITGLSNLGCTCYQNAVIQSLFNPKEFTNFLIDLSNGFNFSWGESTTYRDITSQLARLLKKMTESPEESLQLIEFAKTFQTLWPNFSVGIQQDAEEFLSTLLDCLHDSLKERCVSAPAHPNQSTDLATQIEMAWISRTKSVISDIFYSQQVNMIKCGGEGCNDTRVYCQNMSSHLTLTVRYSKCSLLDILRDSFASTSPLHGSTCESCGGGTLNSEDRLGRLPAVLIMHLSRFQQTSPGQFTGNNQTVDIPFDLDMAQFTTPDNLQSNTRYELFAVVNHTGSLTGHYVAYCKQGDRWFEIDDSWAGGIPSRKISGSGAYLLFYKCIRGESKNLPFDADLSSDNCVLPEVVSSEEYRSSGAQTNNVVEASTTVKERGRRKQSVCSPAKRSRKCLSTVDVRSGQETTTRSLSATCPEQPLHRDGTATSKTAGKALHTSSANDIISRIEMVARIESFAEPNEDFCGIVLTEDDVPGAKLSLDKINEYLVPQLQRWLKCRDPTQTGSKVALCERILSHVRMDKGAKIDPKIDGDVWYDKKRALLTSSLENDRRHIPRLPAGPNVWKEFPSYDIPSGFNKDQVDVYVKTLPAWTFSYSRGVQQIGPRQQNTLAPETSASGYYTDDDIACASDEENQNEDDYFTRLVRKGVSKCLERGRKFLKIGRILRVWDSEKEQFYFLKAQVQASMESQVYVVTCTIRQDAGRIVDATCTSKARALKRCAHITGVLILVVDHVEAHGYDAVTCTGRPCYWTKRPVAENPGIV